MVVRGVEQPWMVTWCLVSRALTGADDSAVPASVGLQLDRLHAAVAATPALAPHLRRLESEAALVGAVTVRTWRRLCRAIEEATGADDAVAASLTSAWRRLEAAEAQAGFPLEQALRATRSPTVTLPRHALPRADSVSLPRQDRTEATPGPTLTR